MSALLWVSLGALIGAPGRFLVDRWARDRRSPRFLPAGLPWGTLLVNVVGSLVLGILWGLADGRAVPAQVTLAIGTGLCGALTTYSTLSYETLRLYEQGTPRTAVANVAITLAAGVAVALTGYAAARALA